MREILFRGKQVEIGPFATESVCEWAYGGYAQDSSGTYIYDFMRPKRMVKVDPATVGQYTGLKDRDGKKIFEGDIVAFEDATADYEGYHDNVFVNRAVVKYDEYSWALCGNISVVTTDDLVYKGEFDGEVIGNVHDNPELLEGGGEE